MNSEFSVIGYSFAGIAFLVLALMLLPQSRGKSHSVWLVIAAVASAVWGLALASGAPAFTEITFQVFLLEILHDGFWLLFMSMLLGGAVGQRRFRVARFAGLGCVALVLLLGSWANSGISLGPFLPELHRTLFFGSLLTSLFVFVGLEQIFRNARTSQRKGLKYLCLGVGAVFAYDILLYSNAILSNQISGSLWSARGVIVLMCVPIIGIATVRGPSWLAGIFVSRRVVFYTTTIAFAVIYITVIGIAGFYIRTLGGPWGGAAQLVVLVAALLTLAVLLVSDQTRARIRVYITKHFFESKYDYREEWLRLIETLTSPDDELPLRKRAIKALAQVVDVPSGLLWLRQRGQTEYSCVAGWNTPRPPEVIKGDHSIVGFLRETGWIIDFREYSGNRDRYEMLSVDDELPARPETAFAVPLLDGGDLLGFVFLSQPRTPLTLNFEDHDLLKTAGKQIASYLAQELSTEQLAESRQFEAFNRLTAYLMHDLKNLIAQQSLVVENAQKHRDNPEFIDDAIATIKGGVSRLRRVIEHIQQRSVGPPLQRVELNQLINQAVSQCGDRMPSPEALVDGKQVWVRADRERLLMAVYHALRNAQEATPPEGEVRIELSDDGDDCTVLVTDTGAGMDEAFVRDRLFRPFDSTKGTQGMGIGAYQMRETIRSMGGSVSVQSLVGSGTIVSLGLRVADK